MIKRILGIVGISLYFSMFIYGICSFFTGTELDLYWFYIPLFFSSAMLTSCVLLYSTNSSLWDDVHTAHKNKEGILRMLPDIYIFVEFIEYVGNIKKGRG